jgi:SEC-C motif-containing protein
MQCPCGSKQLFERCCGRLLSGEALATTAEQLMRSRYSAYTQGDEAYLLKTWHSTTRPPKLSFSDSPQWRGLNVIASAESTVEFVARYKVNGKAEKMHEKSRFIREKGEWFYLDGELKGG